MDKNFERGFNYSAANLGASFGAELSHQWINDINMQIESISQLMINEANTKNLDTEQLRGFIAEIWHTKTFNINSTIKHSNSFAERPNINEFGSPDITVNVNGSTDTVRNFSSKYYKTAQHALKAQAATPKERYRAYVEKSTHQGKEPDSMEKFMSDRNVEPGNENMSIYLGQGKLIATDFLEEAKKRVERRLCELEGNKCPTAETKNQILRYKETQAKLTDIVKDGKGVQSIRLTDEQAKQLARAAKKGTLDKELLKKYDISIDSLLGVKDVVRDALIGGLKASAISLIIGFTPTIINGISMLIAEGAIDPEKLKNGGFAALSGSARSFLYGSFTSFVNSCCEAGKIAEMSFKPNSMVTATLVVLIMSTVETALKYAVGKIDKVEMARSIMQLYVTTAFSYAGGVSMATVFSGFPLAYMLGSFIGSIVGGCVYNISEQLFLSYCISSGCVFFGLVDQNYQLPPEVLESLDLEIFSFENFNIEQFQYNQFVPQKFTFDKTDYSKIGLKVLRRDLIGVYSIGYV